MKVLLASDHAGFKRKEKIKEYLIRKRIEKISDYERKQ
jgi:ribose 5-phosphate isomerase RpiB